MTKIQQLKVGEQAAVVSLSKANPIYRQKLLAMGLTPGTQFVVKRVAPLGGPVELQVRGYRLSVRKHEAQVLEIVRV